MDWHFSSSPFLFWLVSLCFSLSWIVLSSRLCRGPPYVCLVVLLTIFSACCRRFVHLRWGSFAVLVAVPVTRLFFIKDNLILLLSQQLQLCSSFHYCCCLHFILNFPVQSPVSCDRFFKLPISPIFQFIFNVRFGGSDEHSFQKLDLKMTHTSLYNCECEIRKF